MNGQGIVPWSFCVRFLLRSLQDLMNKRMLHTALTVLIMIFIFSQSALPAALSLKESGLIVSIIAKIFRLDTESLTFVIRKCAHFAEYMVLGISLRLTVRDWLEERAAGVPLKKDRAYKDYVWKCAVISWGIGTVYAVTDEIHQSFVPGRSCELRDIMIDSCGVAAGIVQGMALGIALGNAVMSLGGRPEECIKEEERKKEDECIKEEEHKKEDECVKE